MVEGFSLGSYLLLVDYTGRLFRAGKAVLSREVAEILDRLGSSAEHWQARLEKLRQGRLLGRFLAASSPAAPRSRRASGCEAGAQPGRLPGVLTRHRSQGADRAARKGVLGGWL